MQKILENTMSVCFSVCFKTEPKLTEWAIQFFIDRKFKIYHNKFASPKWCKGSVAPEIYFGGFPFE